MQSELTLLIDVDDVMVDLLGSVIEHIKVVEGTTYPRDVFVKHEFFDSINRQDLRPAWKLKIDKGNYVYNLKEIDGAIEAIETFRSMDIIMHPVTAPMYGSATWIHERSLWLMERMKFPFDDQIHTAAKHMIYGDVMIDDRPKNLEGFLKRNPNGKAMLFDQPWNRSIQGPWIRVKSWNEVINEINDLNRCYEFFGKV